MSSKKNKKILFIADHASNYIPSSLKNLGLKKNQINSHIAYDVGVKELCINLSNLLNSNYIKGRIDMKKPNKIREARLNKIRSRKNNIRKEKVRLKKIEEANTPQPEPQQ